MGTIALRLGRRHDDGHDHFTADTQKLRDHIILYRRKSGKTVKCHDAAFQLFGLQDISGKDIQPLFLGNILLPQPFLKCLIDLLDILKLRLQQLLSFGVIDQTLHLLHAQAVLHKLRDHGLHFVDIAAAL